MQWWAIIKMIAGIIANLPFSEQTTEDEVKAVVALAISDVQSEPGVLADAGIPQSEWEELIGLITPIILWILKRFAK